MISAFEGADDSALAMLVGGGDQAAGDLREAVFGEVDLGEGVEVVGVEAGGEEEEIGVKIVEGGKDRFVHRGLVIVVGAAGGHGDVDDAAVGGAFAGFGGVAGAGVTGGGVLMNADEEDRAVGVENGLGAVAVVDVEIDDGDFIEAVFLLEVTGGDGDVGEEAESHGRIGLGVVAGRADSVEGAADGAVYDGVAAGEERAGGEQGGVEAGGGDDGVGVEVTAGGAGLADVIDVG